MFSKFFGIFSKDLGIDLGTANTLVYVKGEGVLINEPSVVAINQKTGQVVAIGSEAKKMVGRTPGHITALRPLVEGVISDFEVTAEMLNYFIKKVHSPTQQLFARPRVVIGIPSSITEVERRAVRDAARNAGAREVYLVEEPMAAAIGARLPIQEAVGNMVIDLGGGTTDIAVISLGGIVASRNLRIAGDRFNEDIAAYARDEFKLLIGERTAEDIKISIGSVWKTNEILEGALRGRDLVTGLPREVLVTDSDIRAALAKSMRTVIDAAKNTIEDTPPELVSDIMHRGILLVGGGSLIRGLDKLLERETKMPVYLAEDPLTTVVRGTGIILEDLESISEVFIEDDYDLPPQ
ncbi:rod shape-determining protein [Candidatus Giovannonibacteria bacterium RIFCSPLOWO2_12_FULL_44_25]|uniref:Cell shape-determining protein MreB n=2 Tax=Candidatus Giovannoniibacteriota TaxID=1752738 RepID=A0A1F5WBL4_9BACT|nr:MAG: Cell shape determining protein, MreB/Mrl family [Candidatus Giovannonibacteria bacterium GW2011_GWA1_44_25]KKU29620.1 MAG: Cell shape determining protein, MreB/Mrl family [Candidatus Giovannonibacteria bacterium GW2011_GWB1_46_20]OGF50329.1 MAG: rod shape-determining protein [Candidatus Giovannonibacteria bacterium GWA2_45_15]OGF60135.1 MAG: rod shape-determining protein [Candidatus Giovannonibacteria bacterium RIFCSPHIGHO2_01_45_12]OGF60861.1 MAG: rod shape-determining protein [Candida